MNVNSEVRNEKEALAKKLADAGISFDVGLSSPTCLIVYGPDGRRRWLVHEERTYDPRNQTETINCCLITSGDSDYAMAVIAENSKLRELASAAICHMTPEGHQENCNRECPAYKVCAGRSECEIINWIDARARELGIEVE